MRGLEVPPLVVWVEGEKEGGMRGGRAGGNGGGVLIDVPTPDFSMPFNVVTLTCTLLAFVFGSMMSVTVRKGKRRGKKHGGSDGWEWKARVKLWWMRMKGMTYKVPEPRSRSPSLRK